jgi:hypothetical protein
MSAAQQIFSIFVLSKSHSPGIADGLNDEKELQRAKVFNRESEGELSKQTITGNLRRTCNDDIIHIDEHIDSQITPPKDEQRGVSRRRSKAELVQLIREPRIPRPRRLLEAVDRLVQLTDIIRMLSGS